MNGFLQVIKTDELENSTSYVMALNPQGVQLVLDGKITMAELKVYLTLASYLDISTGLCYPAQDTIAKKMGLARETVNRHINSLVRKGCIQIVKEKREHNWCYNTYRFNDLNIKYEDTLLDKEGVATEEEEDVQILTARDFVSYFCKQYFKKYGETYLVNYAKDCSIVKKVTDAVSPEECKGIIDMCFEHYDTKWASKQYPRPNLYPLTDWIGRDCLRLYWAKKKQEEEMKQVQEQKDDTDKFLDMFGGE